MSVVRKNLIAAFAAAIVAIGSTPSVSAPLVFSGPSIERLPEVLPVSRSTSRKRLHKGPSGQAHNGPSRGGRSFSGPSSRNPSRMRESHGKSRHPGNRPSYNRPTPNKFSYNRPTRRGEAPSSSRPSRDRHNRLPWYGDGPSHDRFSDKRRQNFNESSRDRRLHGRRSPDRLPWNAYGPTDYNPSYKRFPNDRQGPSHNRRPYDRSPPDRLPWNAYGPSHYNPSSNLPSHGGPSFQGDIPWDTKRWYRGGRPWEQGRDGSSGDRPRRGERPGHWNGHNGSNDYKPGWKQHADGWWYPPVAFGLDIVIDGSGAGQSSYSDAHLRWCYERHRTYRAGDNTFQPTDGPRQQCFSPYF